MVEGSPGEQAAESFTDGFGADMRATKPSLRDANGRGALLFVVRPTELVRQGQRVEQVPAVLLRAAPACGRERFGRVCRDGLPVDTARLTLEAVRSPSGYGQSFREGLRGDPYLQHSISID